LVVRPSGDGRCIAATAQTTRTRLISARIRARETITSRLSQAPDRNCRETAARVISSDANPSSNLVTIQHFIWREVNQGLQDA
jgi:hypothetical protein